MTPPCILLDRRIYHPKHGPQTWPWWRWVTISLVQHRGRRADGTDGPIRGGYNLWVYTRWGAICFEAHLQRPAKEAA